MQPPQAAGLEAGEPGRPLSTAAPITSSRASTCSQASSTPTGSGGTSASAGSARAPRPAACRGARRPPRPRARPRRRTAPAPARARARRGPPAARHAAGGDGELEAGKQDADDQGERMFATKRAGWPFRGERRPRHPERPHEGLGPLRRGPPCLPGSPSRSSGLRHHRVSHGPPSTPPRTAAAPAAADVRSEQPLGNELDRHAHLGAVAPQHAPPSDEHLRRARRARPRSQRGCGGTEDAGGPARGRTRSAVTVRRGAGAARSARLVDAQRGPGRVARAVVAQQDARAGGGTASHRDPTRSAVRMRSDRGAVRTARAGPPASGLSGSGASVGRAARRALARSAASPSWADLRSQRRSRR